MTPLSHTVRQVKSTGHNLNARFGGVRKPSSAQRSPINIATFAEAEAFNQLLARQAATVQSQNAANVVQNNTPTVAPFSGSQIPSEHEFGSMAQKLDIANRYQLAATQHLTLSTVSPPVTPFNTEFGHHGQGHLGLPPVSAPPQYASFSDFTPPYSAGPLTNSSWSDAPLTSPDVPNFPAVTYIPSAGHNQMTESMPGHFQHFMLPSDNKADLDGMSPHLDQKKTEFFIQEFPNQKEEHAHVAQQLAQNQPKNYVFANTAPSDYDQL